MSQAAEPDDITHVARAYAELIGAVHAGRVTGVARDRKARIAWLDAVADKAAALAAAAATERHALADLDGD